MDIIDKYCYKKRGFFSGIIGLVTKSTRPDYMYQIQYGSNIYYFDNADEVVIVADQNSVCKYCET